MKLKVICLDKIKSLLIQSHPANVNDCEVIVNQVNQLPINLICDLERRFFSISDFELRPSYSELQYWIWYKIFLQEKCSKFWLNKDYRTQIGWFTTPFLHAVRSNHKLVVKLLLKTLENENSYVDVKKADFYYPPHFEKRLIPIDWLLHEKNFDMIEILLETLNNENPDKRIEITLDAIYKAFQDKTIDNNFAKLLYSKADKVTKISSIYMGCQRVGMVARFEIIFRDDAKTIESLFSNEANIKAINRWELNPLCLAAKNINHGADILKHLLSKFSSIWPINSEDSNSMSALMIACHENNVNAVKVILATLDSEDLNSRVDLEKVNNDEETAFHITCKKGHLEIAQLLLATNINANKTNKIGQSALHLACDNGHLEVVQQLLQVSGINVNLECHDRNETALQIAARKGYLKIVKSLSETLALDDMDSKLV